MKSQYHAHRSAAAALFLTLSASIAMAQTALTPSSFEPGVNDLTRHVLTSIFGDWSNGSMVPVVGEAMRVLNFFALTFGTLMFTYIAVVGTLNSAQDGEILGRKWSSMWVPMRFVGGTAFLVPLASGYSTVQHLVLWLALVGGGGASQVWQAAVNGFTSPDQAATLVQDTAEMRSKVKTVLRSVLKAEVCTAILNVQYQGTATFGMSAPSPMSTPGVAGSPMAYLNGYVFTWGDLSGDGGKTPDACGSAKTSTFASDSPINATFGNPYTGGMPGPMPNVAPTGQMRSALQAMTSAQATGLQTAAGVLRPLAKAMAADTSATTITNAQIDAALTQAVTAYMGATTSASGAIVSAATAKLTAFLTSAADAGWMMASSSFFQMGRIRSAAAAAMNAVPEVKERADTEGTSAGVFAGVAESALFEDVKAAETRIALAFQGTSGDVSDNWWSGNFGQFLARRMGQAFSFDPSSSKHALVQIKDTGDVILDTTSAAAAAGVTFYVGQATAGNQFLGKVADAATGGFSGLRAFLEILGPVIMLGFFGLFGIGITMAYLLPMLPFMLSIGSILGWLMAVFSAVTAAPIWMAGHLHPEGDGFAGKAIGGYMLLLETVTRPVFITFGLIGAFAMMDPMLRFVAWAFQVNMQSMQGNSVTGIIGVGVFASIYVAIVWTVVRQSLQLIHSLSEKVYNWIGGQNAGYDQARDFGSAAQQNTERAASGVKTGLNKGVEGAVTLGQQRHLALKRQAALRNSADADPADAAGGSGREAV
jgi:conjugal transfer/type IV secretion protein DotA/TraY